MSNEGRSQVRRGFTIIEAMFVVAIVSILSALAMPMYRSMQYRARSAEVSSIVSTVIKAQQAYFSSNDAYANVTVPAGNTLLDPLGAMWSPEPCPDACGRDTPEDCTEFSCIGFSAAGRLHYQYVSPSERVAGAAPEFCVSAQADLDADGRFGEFEFQSDDAHTGAGVFDCALTACPVGIEPFETMNCNVGQW